MVRGGGGGIRMTFIITTDNQEQGWIDSFNKWMGNSWEDFEMNQ